MEYGEKRRSVSFNLNDPEERALYQFSQKINFSGLVKQYLTREFKQQSHQISATPEASFQVNLGGDQ
ncbi:hypothetical protein [Alicyclobacillus dauci]|uniref:Uncharacterized protein n=1 Tax=Alicyclobacillus dauci TaxID=1475485 RepID=A0ABY6ZBD0_9BACL|nr:hypothetical protein [Alicyclobacillus dauci]WAH39486.1 hypothetical protein NZD86_24265 [Alicyclobacillus dauci]WAH39546.1 hypothetical protein NZD86_23965 [Alicyclobacillus dauci]